MAAASGRQSKIGSAYIALIPSFAGFFTAIDREFQQKIPTILDHTFNGTGREYGKKFSDEFAAAFQPALAQSLAQATANPIQLPAPILPAPTHAQFTLPTPILPLPTLQPLHLPAPVVPTPVVPAANAAQAQAAGQQTGSHMLAGMASALAAGVGALAIGGKVRDAIAEGMNKESGNKKLQAQLNLDPAQAEKLKGVTEEVYLANYGESRDSINADMYDIVGSIKGARQASAEELAKMAKDSNNLASAFGLDSHNISQAASSMIASGIAGSWDEAVDTITAGYQTMGARGDDWIDTLKEYSGDFKSFGIDSKRAFTVVNELVTNGAFFNTDTAADFLRETGIQSRSGENKDFLAALGMDPLAVQEAANKGGDEWIKMFQTIIEKAKATGNKSVLGELFGTQAEDQLNAVMQTDWSKLSGPMEDISKRAENLDKILNDNMNSSLGELIRNFQALFLEVIQPGLNWLAPKLKEATAWLKENAWAVNVIAILIGVAMVTAITAATVALWGMLVPMLPMIGTVLAIVAGIALMALGFKLVYDNWGAIVQFGQVVWGGFINWWNEIWGGFFNWLNESFNSIGDWFVGLGKGIGNFFIGIANGVIGLINMMIDAINSIQIHVPAFAGFGGFDWNGIGIPTIAPIASLAQGATINPSPGGSLVRVAEAGRPESVVDTGLLNRQLALSVSAMESNGGTGYNGPQQITYEIHMQPGESIEEFVQRLEEYKDFRGDYN